MYRPVRQRRHPPPAGHQLQDDQGEFRRTPFRRCYSGRLQKMAIDVEPPGGNRVGDQRLVPEIRRLDPALPGQRMPVGHHQHPLETKQGMINHPRQRLRIGGDDQIQVPAHQRRQRLEAVRQGDIHLHLGPVRPVGIHRRHQPFEAAVTLDGDVQPSALPLPHPLQLGQRTLHLR